jgi:N-acyl-D-aspartate/D-glutamate deacylase
MLGISMDPSGKRASGVIAWQQTDGSIGLRVVAEVHGDPIDVDKLGKDLSQLGLKLGVSKKGFDDWTDKELAKHLKDAKAINGREFANASENFVRLIDAGRLRWDVADAVTADLAWTARKPHESGAWMAVKASPEHPITASLAAIRAVWLASGPKPAAPRVL